MVDGQICYSLAVSLGTITYNLEKDLTANKSCIVLSNYAVRFEHNYSPTTSTIRAVAHQTQLSEDVPFSMEFVKHPVPHTSLNRPIKII